LVGWEMIMRTIIAFLFVSGYFCRLGLADGMPIENGRFCGGATSVIRLTSEQMEALNRQQMRGECKTLVLNNLQRLQLQNEAGAAPNKLDIYNTRLNENDCTCEAVNRGLWFTATQLEVPHAYLQNEGHPPMTDSALSRSLVYYAAIVSLGVFGMFLLLRFLRRREQSHAAGDPNRASDA